MDKKQTTPPVWKWEEGDVDKKEEHIKVGYGGYGEPFVPLALVAPGKDNCFIVQFLMKKDDIDPAKQENYDELIKDLNFFLKDSCEENSGYT